ncbi:hypothetical protein KL864_31450 [Mycolicibacterium goodii]|uniref:hypothetical protein n=1 Tax=Mycolicibacterium goodii TaxID=134601 RepID=UPI001BDCB3A8|nr:hypothetical protein [Mycolicibacterium goodii]MBU8820394.1 hypothetical protein [Mycolicibacterium goodii]
MIFNFGTQASVWTPWIPLLGSLVVALGAYYGIRKTTQKSQLAIDKGVENNQKAIDEASRREIEKWYRETLIRLCEEASSAQRDIDRRYNTEAVSTTEKWEAYQDAVWMGTRKLGSLADSFTILGADDLNDKCAALRRAAEAVAKPAKILRDQALANPNEKVRNLPGWVEHYNALVALSNAREELIFAAAKRSKALMKSD